MVLLVETWELPVLTSLPASNSNAAKPTPARRQLERLASGNGVYHTFCTVTKKKPSASRRVLMFILKISHTRVSVTFWPAILQTGQLRTNRASQGMMG